jgi:hypothetical protein
MFRGIGGSKLWDIEVAVFEIDPKLFEDASEEPVGLRMMRELGLEPPEHGRQLGGGESLVHVPWIVRREGRFHDLAGEQSEFFDRSKSVVDEYLPSVEPRSPFLVVPN